MNLVISLRGLVATLVLASLAACGGSDSSTPDPETPPPTPPKLSCAP